eukprot:1971123-Amphidinium_carterae.2
MHRCTCAQPPEADQHDPSRIDGSWSPTIADRMTVSVCALFSPSCRCPVDNAEKLQQSRHRQWNQNS